MKKLNILVACEESQVVTKALRKLKHNAYSCDLLKCSGKRPNWHFNCDVFKVINELGGELQSGKKVKVKKWDLMIAHPPCTYLAVSGARWFYDPKDKDKPIHKRNHHPDYPDRKTHREEALKFFIKLTKVKIEKIAIENPVGIVSTKFRKPDQIVQPWMFGDEATKTTCLWLKGLPLLTIKKEDEVGKGPKTTFKSGKSQPKWYSDAFVNAKTSEERRTMRSKTFPGLAKAMAEQWTKI